MGQNDRYRVVDTDSNSLYPPGLDAFADMAGVPTRDHSATVEGSDGTVTEGSGSSRDAAVRDAIDEQQ